VWLANATGGVACVCTAVVALVHDVILPAVVDHTGDDGCGRAQLQSVDIAKLCKPCEAVQDVQLLQQAALLSKTARTCLSRTIPNF
jgi:hypothetical protein